MPANFCTGFDFALRLQGTFGTEDAQQVLATLGPVNEDNEALKKAKDSGYAHNLVSMRNLQLVTPASESLIVQWDLMDSTYCFDGFMLVLEGTGKTQFVGKSTNTAIFMDLEPCKKYFISGYLYMGKNADDDQPPLFSSLDSGFAMAKTLPDMSSPFALKTVKAKITKRSIRVAWDKSELTSCISHTDLKASVCKNYLQRGTCFQSREIQEFGQDKYKVEFNQLDPCTDYQVFHYSDVIQSWRYGYHLFLAPDRTCSSIKGCSR